MSGLWALVPFVALAVAVPLALRYDRRAAERWRAEHSPKITLTITIDTTKFTSAMQDLRESMARVARSVDTVGDSMRALAAAWERRP